MQLQKLESSEPDFEKGDYIYFDYKVTHDNIASGWCYRLKSSFHMQYDMLENEF